MVAPGNEHLRSADGVGSAAPRQGGRPQQSHIGSRVCLGEAHRGQPFAADDLRQKMLFEMVGAVGANALVRAVGQSRVHRPCMIRRVEHLVERGVERLRQSLAAAAGIARQSRPTGSAEVSIRRGKTRRGMHRSAGKAAALQIAGRVHRQQTPHREFSGLLEYLGHEIGIEARQSRHLVPIAAHVQQLIEHEPNIVDRGNVAPHKDQPRIRHIASSLHPPLRLLAPIAVPRHTVQPPHPLAVRCSASVSAKPTRI